MSARGDGGLQGMVLRSAGTIGRQLAAGLLQLATVMVIARVYGPSINGAYALALLVPSVLATVLNLGIAPANVYFIASRQYGPRAVCRTTATLLVGLSILGCLVGSVVLWHRGTQAFPGVPVAMLWMALTAFPLMLAQAFVSSIFQGLQRFAAFNISLLAQPVVTFLLVLFLASAGAKELSFLIAAYLLGLLVTLIITSVILVRMVRGQQTGPEYPYTTVLRYGYKAHLSNILAFVNYKADIFLVNIFLGPAFTGIYVIAVQVSERLWLLSQAVSTVALPRLSELASNEDLRRQLTPLLTRVVVSITAAAALLLALVVFPLVRLLFGPEYESSCWPLIFLLPGVVAGSASRLLANDIAARGRPELNMYMSIITVSVNIGANIALIPRFGLGGAAIATTLAYCLNLGLRLIIYYRQTGIPPQRVLLLTKKDVVGTWNTLRHVGASRSR